MAEKALVNYIRDALAAGANFQQIHDILKSQEWPEQSIEQAMAEAAQPQRALTPRALAAPFPPTPPPGFQPIQSAPPLRRGAPHGFGLAFAGGIAILARVLGGMAAGLPNPFAPALAPAAPVVGLLFGILIIVAALLLKKGKSPAGVIALALSAVLTAFSADLTLTAPALLAAAGGAVGLAKR